MKTYDAIVKRRTVRKYTQKPVELSLLYKLIDAARRAPSAMNLQPLRYRLVQDPAEVQAMFPLVSWAGHIAPAGNPLPGEEPTAYIVNLVDTRVRASGYESDIGAAVENILLTAVEEGLGCCWIGSVKRDQVRELLRIPPEYKIDTVIALGYQGESPVMEDVELRRDLSYYKDGEGTLHVPKIRLEDVIIE